MTISGATQPGYCCTGCWNNSPPTSRMIIQLLEIEEKSLKEIAELTGWSISMIKVRAFRARAAMKKVLEKLDTDKYM